MSIPLKSNRLDSKVAIITGASSGLGRAIALDFAANGSSLIVCSDLRPEARGAWGASQADIHTHDLINQRYGEGKAIYVKTDVTKAEEVEHAVKEAVRVGGRLDVMCNNAGTGGTESAGKVHEMSEDTWDFTMYAPIPSHSLRYPPLFPS